eukprot:3109109-Pyramimonas_sp.AAC.2
MCSNRSLGAVERQNEDNVESQKTNSDDVLPSAVIEDDQVKDELEHSEEWVKTAQRAKRRRGELPDLPSLKGIEIKPKKFQPSDVFLNQVPRKPIHNCNCLNVGGEATN